MAMLATACGETKSPELADPTSDIIDAPSIDESGEGFSISVDTDLRPVFEALPADENGGERPVAAVTGDDGDLAMFVANEMWVTTDDPAELDAIMARHDATLIASIHPQEFGIESMVAQHLLRLPTVEVSGEMLEDDLHQLAEGSSGSFAVSSEEGLSLLTSVASEAVEGLPVGINWVGLPADFDDRVSEEAPSGETFQDGGVLYDPNAFLWPTHDEGDNSNLDIGVAEAWRALEAAGGGATIGVAVLDMGFFPDADWPDNWTASSTIGYPNDAIGRENLLWCGDWTECPWHGTNVFSAAMAVPDNGYGAAGPAGPVAEPLALFTTYDMFFSMNALVQARSVGVEIANMSYGVAVPWYVSWSVIPFEVATTALRVSGMLIFAAAGNAGANVDKVGCTLGVCFERDWHTPCENIGVICVGGTRPVSRERARYSNFGHEDVDIFAPFEVWVGPDPESPENIAQRMSGTSFSSPFAAGVAALIWAANPFMAAGTVEDILMRTAHHSDDPDVSGIVNAYDGVRAALGNIHPEIDLVSPTNGREIELGLPVQLRVNVSDFEDGGSACCDVVWSTGDGTVLGLTADVEVVFDETGPYQLTATVTDQDGATSSVTTSIQVRNSPPTMTISNPVPSATVFRGIPFGVSGSSFDINLGGPLECSALRWSTNVPSELSVTGCTATVTLNEVGPRTVTLTGQDPLLAEGTATIDIHVIAPPDDLPPVVQILEPGPLDGVADQPTTLSGSAIDPEGDDNLTYQWVLRWPYDRNTDSAENEAVIGTEPTVIWEPRDQIDGLGGSSELSMRLLVELRVSDSTGNTGVAAVEMTLTQIN